MCPKQASVCLRLSASALFFRLCPMDWAGGGYGEGLLITRRIRGVDLQRFPEHASFPGSVRQFCANVFQTTLAGLRRISPSGAQAAAEWAKPTRSAGGRSEDTFLGRNFPRKRLAVKKKKKTKKTNQMMKKKKEKKKKKTQKNKNNTIITLILHPLIVIITIMQT